MTLPSQLHVLVVEDDPSALGYLMRQVAAWGYLAEGAASAAEALKRVAHRCPHVILSDLVMPGMSGVDLLKELKSIPQCSIRFVLFTGYPSVTSVVDAITQGADDCLFKPIDAEKLHAILQKIDADRVAA